MKNRCSFCESMDNDIICWKCYRELTNDQDKQILALMDRIDSLSKRVTELER